MDRFHWAIANPIFNACRQVLFLLSKAMILLIEKNNMDEAAEILETTTPILDSWIGTSTLTESLRVFELVLKVWQSVLQLKCARVCPWLCYGTQFLITLSIHAIHGRSPVI